LILPKPNKVLPKFIQFYQNPIRFAPALEKFARGSSRISSSYVTGYALKKIIVSSTISLKCKSSFQFLNTKRMHLTEGNEEIE